MCGWVGYWRVRFGSVDLDGDAVGERGAHVHVAVAGRRDQAEHLSKPDTYITHVSHVKHI